jgi:hypothetical protein
MTQLVNKLRAGEQSVSMWTGRGPAVFDAEGSVAISLGTL